MIAKKERLTILPTYSIILCMMVVLIHNHISHYYEYGDNLVNNVIHYVLIELIPNFTDIAVPSFFMLSGFLFFRNYELNKTLEKYKSRINTLLIPYLIWNVVGLLFEMITRIPSIAALGKVNSNPFLLKSIVCGVFLHQYSVLWFIFALLIYVIFAPIFYLMIKCKVLGILSIIVVACCLVFDIIHIHLPNGCYFEETSLLYYMLGAYLGIHVKQFYGKQAKPINAVISISIFFALTCLELIFPNHLYKYEVFILVLKSITFWFFCSLVCSYIKQRSWFCLSFFIYVSHYYLIRAVSAIVRLVGNSMDMECMQHAELLLYILTFLITMSISVCWAFVWKKYNNRLFNIVTGCRG